ncbi:hypothetical protein L2E82_19801 [Cichorium intybus]|uniref:Uncharacterized protein n=1 Tax=Cichorium intybus TaxID=13427 RepID=A0ACB9DRB2_CICIN|nr:hypothetical protein L2E82_19801 [Cichorium intybus]
MFSFLPKPLQSPFDFLLYIDFASSYFIAPKCSLLTTTSPYSIEGSPRLDRGGIPNSGQRGEIDKENDILMECVITREIDVVSAPRPKCVRIVTATADEKDFAMEYGLPSSHTLNTVCSSNNGNLPIPSFAIIHPLFLPTFPNFQKLLISHLKKLLYVEVH